MREEEGDSEFDYDKWLDLVAEKIGPVAREDFTDIILNGETIVPAPDAFGPCFDRRPTTYVDDEGVEFDGYEWIRVDAVSDEKSMEY